MDVGDQQELARAGLRQGPCRSECRHQQNQCDPTEDRKRRVRGRVRVRGRGRCVPPTPRNRNALANSVVFWPWMAHRGGSFLGPALPIHDRPLRSDVDRLGEQSAWARTVAIEVRWKFAPVPENSQSKLIPEDPGRTEGPRSAARDVYPASRGSGSGRGHPLSGAWETWMAPIVIRPEVASVAPREVCLRKLLCCRRFSAKASASGLRLVNSGLQSRL